MKRTGADVIVEFLSFSGETEFCAKLLGTIGPREWSRLLRWMDNVGLPFYFLDRLRKTNCAFAVPDWVIARLESNFTANRERLDEMSRQFSEINQAFDKAGIPYAVLKGFSLVPQFCPDASLRHQSDFDYLIAEQSLPRAEQVLIEAGYRPKPRVCDVEVVFLRPHAPRVTATEDQYRAQSPYAVELHLDIWDSKLHQLPSLEKMFSPSRTQLYHWNQLSFPALCDEDAFLVQMLHACSHLFIYWIRLSSLYEIGYFLEQRKSDAALWARIEQRVGANQELRDFTVVITELAAQLFGAPLPEPILRWGANIRPATRVWIENYARQCAFSSHVPVYQFRFFPNSKLVLFLHQQYERSAGQRSLAGKRLITASPRLSRLSTSIRTKPSLLFKPSWWKRHMLIRRCTFHVLAGIRYLCELPRWLWLNRVQMRSGSPSV